MERFVAKGRGDSGYSRTLIAMEISSIGKPELCSSISGKTYPGKNSISNH
jgi:hypothetical protein